MQEHAFEKAIERAVALDFDAVADHFAFEPDQVTEVDLAHVCKAVAYQTLRQDFDNNGVITPDGIQRGLRDADVEVQPGRAVADADALRGRRLPDALRKADGGGVRSRERRHRYYGAFARLAQRHDALTEAIHTMADAVYDDDRSMLHASIRAIRRHLHGAEANLRDGAAAAIASGMDPQRVARAGVQFHVNQMQRLQTLCERVEQHYGVAQNLCVSHLLESQRRRSYREFSEVVGDDALLDKHASATVHHAKTQASARQCNTMEI